MSARCAQRVWWFDIDVRNRCVLLDGHDGDHSDGLRTWDDYGLQTPREEPSEPPITTSAAGRGQRDHLSAEQVQQIRRLHGQGWKSTAIARKLELPYHVVHQCATYQTYGSVR